MKRFLVILFFTFSTYQIMHAQLGVNLFGSVNQQLIEDAVARGVLLVRQEYQLEDTVTLKRYTWDNQPEFGSSVSFCVLTENGYVISDKAIQPWEYDARFTQYRDSQYRPILSKTYCRTVKDSVYRAVGMLNLSQHQPLANKKWMRISDSLFNDKGFVLDSTVGEKDGWIVLLTADDPSQIDSTELSLVIYRHKLTVEAGVEQQDIPSVATQRHVVGGIYIEPQYRGIGEIVFALNGVLVHEEDSWQLLHINRVPGGALTVETQIPPTSLTPVESDTADQSKLKDKQCHKNKKQKE